MRLGRQGSLQADGKLADTSPDRSLLWAVAGFL